MATMKEMQAAHTLLVPFPIEGHINGLLRLAHALSAYPGLRISFAYPARFHAVAQTGNGLLSELALSRPNFCIEVIPDGLPINPDVVPSIHQLMAAVSVFQAGVEAVAERLSTTRFVDVAHGQSQPSCASVPPPPICCIISDTFAPWTQDLANRVKLPRVEFWSSTAAVYAMGTYLPELISRGHLPLKHGKDYLPWIVQAPPIDFIPGLPSFPVTDLPHEFVSSADLNSPRFQFMLSAFSRFKEADSILAHSPYEMESKVFDELKALGYPIHAVGPLFDSSQLGVAEPAAIAHECLQWLGKQKPASVLYVALGTLATIKLKELEALALGLEAAGHPFLWVVRKDALSEGSLSDGGLAELIRRCVANGKGFVVPWAPQTEVLKHSSIGAFLSHCGWNSTLESLWEGVPILGCPRSAEQRSNARWIVENWKVGVEVERDHDDGSFKKEDVHAAIESIMGTKGELFRNRALSLKDTLRNTTQPGGTSHTNLSNFVKHLCQLSDFVTMSS